MKFQYRYENISIANFRNKFKSDDKVTYIERIERNTFKYNINGILKVRLYETDIVIYKKNSILLYNGDFDSKLTMNRINNILDETFQIMFNDPENYTFPTLYKKNHIWYYKDKFNNTTRFFEGIEIDKETSKVINQKSVPNYKKEDKKRMIY